MDFSMAPKEFVSLIFMIFCLHPGLAIEETQSQDTSIPSGALRKTYNGRKFALDKLFSGTAKPDVGLDAINPADAVIVEQYATLDTNKGVYKDARAELIVYGVPEIKMSQTSAAFLQLFSKGAGNDNLIEAGWHVARYIYNDSKTHFFVRFLGKNGIGCYNLYCKGFVRESSSRMIPGHILKPVSTYNGPQYSILVWITRNVHNGNWELYRKKREGTHQLIGYWPVTLFNLLSKHAEYVVAGGYVDYDKGDTNPPPMGSGHFASEGYGKAAGLLLKHQKNGRLYTLFGNAYTDRKDCYTIDGSKKGNNYSFFGGPAGCKG